MNAMSEYLEEWERYVIDHYRPEDMNSRGKLDELYRIADIMKDLAEYDNASKGLTMGMM
jgi:hypothetical protein